MPVEQIFQGWRVHSDGWVIKPNGQFFRGHFKTNTNRTGSNPKLYWCVNLAKRPHRVHRLIAKALVKNDYPDVCTEVDHINGDSLDNRTCNLRWCTHAINLLNQQNNPHLNKSGTRWVASACNTHLGTYDTKEEARAVVKKFKDEKEARLWAEVKRAQFAIDVGKEHASFSFVH